MALSPNSMCNENIIFNIRMFNMLILYMLMFKCNTINMYYLETYVKKKIIYLISEIVSANAHRRNERLSG